MAQRSIPKGVVKDIIIVVVGVLIIWVGLQVAFGTPNPFYVVASGSMVPVLEIHDVLIVQGHVSFADVQPGDIIVFNRPSDHNRVIVHRVESILADEPKTIRTKGDANPASIPGTDFPITEEEYIGKVVYTISQVGYITQLLQPPINYVIVVLVLGVMILKHFLKKKNAKKSPSTDPENIEELSDVDKIKKDLEYSHHVDENVGTSESKNHDDKSESKNHDDKSESKYHDDKSD